jgi:DNA replication initiation complex subunit (GINS family)
MEEGIITYDKLYEILRLEKYKKELQKIEGDFFTKVVRYLEEKKAILQSQENKTSVFASQSIANTKRQLENTNMILKEIYERREAKIIQLALFNSRTGERMQDVDALLDDEVKLYNSLVVSFNLYRNGILGNILNGEMPKVIEVKGNIVSDEKKEKLNKLVRFLQAVPRFVGDDLIEYGPFEAEDMANLPVKVSEVLIKNQRAEEV